MLICETLYNFNTPGFVFHKINHTDGKALGGTGILNRNRLRHFAVNERLYTGNLDVSRMQKW